MDASGSSNSGYPEVVLTPRVEVTPKDLLHSIVTWSDEISEAERQMFIASVQLDRFIRQPFDTFSSSGADIYWVGNAPEYPYLVKIVRNQTSYVAALIREFHVGGCLNRKKLDCFVRTLCFASGGQYVYLVQDRAPGLRFSEWIHPPELSQITQHGYKSRFELWLENPVVMKNFQTVGAHVLMCIKKFLQSNVTLYNVDLDSVFVEGPPPNQEPDPKHPYKIKFVSYRKAHVPEFTSNSMFYLSRENDRVIDHAPGLFDGAIDYQLFLTNLYRLIYMERDINEKNEILEILPRATLVPMWPRPESRVMAYMRDVILLPVSPNTGVLSAIDLVKDYVKFATGLAVEKGAYFVKKAMFDAYPPHERNIKTWVALMDTYVEQYPQELTSYRWRMGEAWNYTWHTARQAYFNSPDYQALVNMVQQWLNYIN